MPATTEDAEMTTSDRSRPDDGAGSAGETVDPVDPLEPTADDSVLADAPDTATGQGHLLQNDEGTPGPGVWPSGRSRDATEKTSPGGTRVRRRPRSAWRSAPPGRAPGGSYPSF